jgi:hypothetical protein
MAYIYALVIGACLIYIAKHYHWPFGVSLAVLVAVIAFAAFVARIVEDDRK